MVRKMIWYSWMRAVYLLRCSGQNGRIERANVLWKENEYELVVEIKDGNSG